MAARQDQGLQIALIVLIFLFILTAVAAYIGWKGYSDTDQLLTTTQGKLRDAEDQVRKIADDNSQLRTMMGFGAEDAVESVAEAFEADMKKYGAAIADEDRLAYRTVLQSVWEESQKTADREADAKDQLKELTARYEALEAETQKQLAQYREQMKKLDEDAASQRRTFAQDRQGLEDKKKELDENLRKQRAQLESEIAKRDTSIKDLTEKTAELQQNVQDLQQQIPSDTESFEVPDGRISWVNQNGTVWIDVGEADFLRRQITFNVYDADEYDADRAQKKGSIEVTRLMGDHMAEARITEDLPTNPILTGDRIYSPVWHRGKKLRFALAGDIDFDGDGASDLKLAQDLIELNGGAVDAYQGDDGKVVGKISAHTRYLILGDAPESALRAHMQTGYNDLSKAAFDLGVETITLDKFLDRMGYASQDRTVRLGTSASAHDFPAGRANDMATEAEPDEASREFRPRTPYRTSVTTPY